MLLVNGEKMSKSLGNFFTLAEVLEKAPGEAVRFLLMRSHYRSTLDFSDAGLKEAKTELDRFYRAIEKHPNATERNVPLMLVFDALLDDLNTPAAIAALHKYADMALAGNEVGAVALKAAGKLLGLFNMSPDEWFQEGIGKAAQHKIDALVTQRIDARRRKDFAESDRIRDEILALGVSIEDGPGGTYKLRRL
jgi:cysteinyl-tRNA synthetase